MSLAMQIDQAPVVLDAATLKALSYTNYAVRVLRGLGAKIVKTDISPAQRGDLPEIVIDAPFDLPVPSFGHHVHVTRKVGGATR